ncbi:hypothetical protein ACSBR1_035933 [Camellia fascicularis]
MWAAIERLSTYDRMSKGMLTKVLHNGKVVHDEIDVTNLEMQHKQLLMERSPDLLQPSLWSMAKIWPHHP